MRTLLFDLPGAEPASCGNLKRFRALRLASRDYALRITHYALSLVHFYSDLGLRGPELVMGTGGRTGRRGCAGWTELEVWSGRRSRWCAGIAGLMLGRQAGVASAGGPG